MTLISDTNGFEKCLKMIA